MRRVIRLSTPPSLTRKRPSARLDHLWIVARRRLRSPIVYWATSAAIGMAAFVGISDRSADLSRREAAFGSSTSVIVVLHDHAAGERIGADDVELRRVPTAMTPADAVRTLDEPVRLSAAVVAGEILVGQRLRSGSTSELAAALPAGRVAVAMGLPAAHLQLRRGDHVDIAALGSSGASEPIARDATVLSANDNSATIAVTRSEAGPVADAVLAATVTIWLRAPDE